MPLSALSIPNPSSVAVVITNEVVGVASVPTFLRPLVKLMQTSSLVATSLSSPRRVTLWPAKSRMSRSASI